MSLTTAAIENVPQRGKNCTLILWMVSPWCRWFHENVQGLVFRVDIVLVSLDRAL